MKQTDIYTEALICLRSILQTDHPEFKNWIGWLERDIEDWTQRREVSHHLRAYGGMGSFNDLPSMRGNHDYTAARFNERTEEQKLQNRPQTRQKKEELSR